MKVELIILLILLASFNILIILYLTEALDFLVHNALMYNSKRLCMNNLKDAIIHNNSDWNDIIAIFSSRNLEIKDLKKSLQKILRDTISNEQSPLSGRLRDIRELLRRSELNETFIGIPNEIRVHLERVQELLQGDDRAAIHPLADQIQDLFLVNSRECRNSKIMASLSVIFGFLGFIIGSYQIFSN